MPRQNSFSRSAHGSGLQKSAYAVFTVGGAADE